MNKNMDSQVSLKPLKQLLSLKAKPLTIKTLINSVIKITVTLVLEKV